MSATVLRKKHMLDILKAVKQNDLITRPEIARKLGVTAVTVNNLITLLTEKDIIREKGQAHSRGGRKATAYHFNKNIHYIIGVNMTVHLITLNLFNLAGELICAGPHMHMDEAQPAEHTVRHIVDGIDQLMRESGKDRRKIIGIGVTVPGRTNFEEGVVLNLPNLRHWTNIPLQAVLEQETGLPARVERDTNAHMQYLKWNDLLNGYQDVVYCSVGEGVGCSVQIDGSVYHGFHGIAGEFGHTILKPDGERCNCGNRGCAETLLSNRAIINRYKKILEEKQLHLNDLLPKTEEDYTDYELVDWILERAQQGDTDAERVFMETVDYLQMYLKNVMNAFDPSLVVVECRWLRKEKRYFDLTISKMFRSYRLLDRNDVRFMVNPVEDIFDVSVAMVMVDWFFNDIENNQYIN